MNFIYKTKFLFFLLQKYWLVKYLFKIFLINGDYYFELTKSQNNNEENLFITNISKYITSKNFIEIGYHYREMNFIGLIKENFFGKLVDADTSHGFNSFMMSKIIKKTNRNVSVIKKFIDLDNIDQIFDMKKLGCLSIDIDGNEYWILENILSKNIIPELIITEYNASFLNHEVSVPYDKNFDVKKKHHSLWYHGASLSAFEKLLSRFNYGLVKVIGGTNAIFIQNEQIQKSNLKKFKSFELYQECWSRNKKGDNTAKEQFDAIKHLPLVKV